MPIEDPNEAAVLTRLARLARGEKADPYAPFEMPPTREEQQEAARQYIEMKKAQETRTAREQDFGLEAQKQAQANQLELDKLRLEVQRLEQANALEVERLKLEAQKLTLAAEAERERIQIQKADVIVRAIEAASRNPNAGKLTEVAQALSDRLLQGPGLPVLQIEATNEKS